MKHTLDQLGVRKGTGEHEGQVELPAFISIDDPEDLERANELARVEEALIGPWGRFCRSARIFFLRLKNRLLRKRS